MPPGDRATTVNAMAARHGRRAMLVAAIGLFGGGVLWAPAPDGLHPHVDRAVDALQVTPVSHPPLTPPITRIEALQKGTCLPEVTTAPLAAASVELEILAPCDPGRPVAVVHDGVRVDAVLDGSGRAIVLLPALREDPIYEVRVPGRPAVQISGAPLDFARYKRAVLLAAPEDGFELHAYEAGAAFGEAGHVRPDRPYDRIRALVGLGGFLDKLGAPGIMGAQVAQVYTVPDGTDVALSLEATVTAANCGRDLSAVAIRTDASGAPVVTALDVAMPGCDAVGEVVLLGDPTR